MRRQRCVYAGRVAQVQHRTIRYELVAGDSIIATARVMMLRIAPVGRFDGISPHTKRRGSAVEAVADDRVVLPVFDRDAGAVAVEIVLPNLGLVTVAGPDAVLAAPHLVRDDPVAREGRFDAVGGRVTHVIAEEQVVVRAPRS